MELDRTGDTVEDDPNLLYRAGEVMDYRISRIVITERFLCRKSTGLK